MKWFMHQSQAHRDMKLKKVLIKYGATGYGLYWYCLEQICADLEPKLTFDLQHDSEILAHELRIDTLKVEEMMHYFVNIGLFEGIDGVITCLKLANHLGDNLTRNPALKTIIKSAKSQTVSDSLRLSQQEERRGEEKRGENTKNYPHLAPPARVFVKPTVEEVATASKLMGLTIDPELFVLHYESNGWKINGNPMESWRARLGVWAKEEAKRSQDKSDRKSASKKKETPAERMRRELEQSENIIQ